jgi:hypothetical protein
MMTLTPAHVAEAHALLMEVYRTSTERLTREQVMDLRTRALNSAIRLKVHCLDQLPTVTLKQE